jgi:PAS domain S-box-containing protein
MSKPTIILLALDESPFLQLGKRALFSAGYETAEAHDRAGLERALQETSPSLLLIGEKLDGKSGIQLSMEQLERFPTLPILLYAEKDSASIAKEVLRAGLSGYIFPPLRTDDIVAAVTRSLEHARFIGDWVRREITRTTASLQRQINDFDAIFNNIGDGVIILDKHGRIILLNQVVCQVFGVTTETMLGKPIAQAIPHPDLQSLLNRSTDQGMKYHEINFHDGRVFNAKYTPIPNVGSAITIQDISYLKALDRVKNDFIHTVSHDLRSPLTSVLGYAELIGRTGPLNEHQRDFMVRLQVSIQSITALVNDLLDLGRLEAGFDTRREIVQLENILAYTLDILQGQISACKLDIRVDQTPNLPPLKANPLRLRQMLDNLIGNAIKYTPPGGRIHISLQTEEDQVILQVRDNGPGIPPADQPHIFEKFYRGENVPDGVPGSGLGLAIVKSIVESHQGRVWVESKLGQGTAIFVVLPPYNLPVP